MILSFLSPSSYYSFKCNVPRVQRSGTLRNTYNLLVVSVRSTRDYYYTDPYYSDTICYKDVYVNPFSSNPNALFLSSRNGRDNSFVDDLPVHVSTQYLVGMMT